MKFSQCVDNQRINERIMNLHSILKLFTLIMNIILVHVSGRVNGDVLRVNVYLSAAGIKMSNACITLTPRRISHVCKHS